MTAMITVLATFLRRHRALNWVLADQAMVSACNFLVNLTLVRELGLAEFGRFILLWMVVLLLSAQQLAVVVVPMMSLGPKHEGDARESYFGGVALLQLALALGMAVLVLVVREIHLLVPSLLPLGEAASGLAALAVALPLIQGQEFLRRYLFVRNLTRMAFLLDAVNYPGRLMVLLWVLPRLGAAEHGGAVALWVMAGIAGMSLCLGLPVLRGLRFGREALVSAASRHWRLAKWLAASALADWAGGSAVTALVGLGLGPEAVGVMAATQNLMNITNVLLIALGNVVPGHASQHLHRGGIDGLAAYLRKIALGGGAATALLLAIMVGAASLCGDRLFRSNDPAIPLLMLLWAVEYFICFAAIPLQAGLGAIEHTRPILAGGLAKVAWNLVLAWPLVQWLGLPGAVLLLIGSALLDKAILWNALQARLRQPAEAAAVSPGTPVEAR